MGITKLKADFDSDTPIGSYATLKKKSGLLVGIDWHRLAPLKIDFFVVSGEHVLRITNQIYKTVPLGKRSRLS